MTPAHKRGVRSYAQQKAGLTRAINSGDSEKVLRECMHTVNEWPSAVWPDDWARWDRALGDAGYRTTLDQLVVT